MKIVSIILIAIVLMGIALPEVMARGSKRETRALAVSIKGNAGKPVQTNPYAMVAYGKEGKVPIVGDLKGSFSTTKVGKSIPTYDKTEKIDRNYKAPPVVSAIKFGGKFNGGFSNMG